MGNFLRTLKREGSPWSKWKNYDNIVIKKDKKGFG